MSTSTPEAQRPKSGYADRLSSIPETTGPHPAEWFKTNISNWSDISPFFTPQELKCRGSGTLLVYWPMLEAYNKLRAEGWLKPHRPNSFYRSPEYNRRIGGARRSRHLFSAVDIPRSAIPNVPGMLRRAVELGFSGFGCYPTFLHLDFRERPAVWPRNKKDNFPEW